MNSEDYSLLPLLESSVPLSVNKFWQLTPNKNAVAVELATRFASLNIKTLIFIQNKGHCESVARGIAQRLIADSPGEPLNEKESVLHQIAIDELGSESSIIGNYSNLALCHHGLLIPAERQLSELMFCRAEGPKVLTATPTLAQGMNLPAEVVIIVGDERHERGSDISKPLAAHEVLNAAGRAGRAGHVSDGVVLMIPGEVTTVEANTRTIGSRWFSLQKTIFDKLDQCLTIDDPIQHFMDALTVDTDYSDDLFRYFVSRLPIDADGGDKSTVRFLRRSLAGFRAKKASQSAGFDKFIKKLVLFRSRNATSEMYSDLYNQLAISSGVTLSIIEDISSELGKSTLDLNQNTAEWVDSFFGWMANSGNYLSSVIDWYQMNRIFKISLPSDGNMAVIIPELAKRAQELLHEWMAAATFSKLENTIGVSIQKVGTCDRAREFVIRRIPDLSYAMGLFAMVHRANLQERQAADKMPLHLATLAACVREGHSQPTELAIRYHHSALISRKRCRFIRESLNIGYLSPYESFPQLYKRVRKALRRASL